MGTILSFPTARTPNEPAIDAAWLAYKALAQAAADEPSLFTDIDHCEAMATAWGKWRDLFLEQGSAA